LATGYHAVTGDFYDFGPGLLDYLRTLNIQSQHHQSRIQLLKNIDETPIPENQNMIEALENEHGILKLGSKRFEPTKITTEGCSDMDDFKESIKGKFSRKLKAYDPSEIALFEADGTTKISAMDSIDQLNEKKMPLVAFVEPVEVQVEVAEKPAISITKHRDYKHSKAVHSSCS
jgi:hypothetical protein